MTDANTLTAPDIGPVQLGGKNVGPVQQERLRRIICLSKGERGSRGALQLRQFKNLERRLRGTSQTLVPLYTQDEYINKVTDSSLSDLAAKLANVGFNAGDGVAVIGDPQLNTLFLQHLISNYDAVRILHPHDAQEGITYDFSQA